MSRRQLLLEGPDLESLLDRIRVEYGEQARILKAEKIRTGGVGGFFARECFNVEVEVPLPESETDPVSETDDEPIIRVGAAAPRNLLDLAETVNAAESTMAAGAPARTLSTDSAAFAEVLAGLQREVSADPLPTYTPFEPAAEISPRRPAAPPPVRTPARASANVRPTATPLGLPAHVFDGAGRPVLDALLQWLGGMPHAPLPMTARGTIIAVVGPVGEAMSTALRLTTLLGTDPAEIQLATAGTPKVNVPVRRRVAAPVLAAKRREAWAAADRPTIVVVDTPLDGTAAEWAQTMLTAIAPNVCWATCHATTKSADVLQWLHRLGGADALAVIGCAATADPAAILELGMPIGLVDGLPSTPTTWAALLLGRLGAP